MSAAQFWQMRGWDREVVTAPVVAEALATGVVSPRQARAAACAEKAQPGAGAPAR